MNGNMYIKLKNERKWKNQGHTPVSVADHSNRISSSSVCPKPSHPYEQRHTSTTSHNCFNVKITGKTY